MSAHDLPQSNKTRREFLRTGTAALGASTMLRGLSPRPDRGRVSQSANDKIGVGVIGVGGMGGAHCEALQRLAAAGKENLQIIAVSDVCKSRVDRWVSNCTKAQGGAKVDGYRYYLELLQRKDIDVVWIASPEHWHAQMAIDAIQAGKDVYVEKPMTLDLQGALKLWEVEKKSDRIVEVGTQYVLEPKYAKAHEHIRAGKIGKAVSSETGYYRNSKSGEWLYQIDPKMEPGELLDWEAWCGPLGQAPFDTEIFHRWRRYRKYSTGIVGDLLVHMVTPLMNILDQGWPVRVVGVGGNHVDAKMENFDQVNLLVSFEKGHTMAASGSTCNATGPAPVIHGHLANLHLAGNKCRFSPEKEFATDIAPEEFELAVDSHDLLRLDFLSCSRTRKRPASSVELGTKVMVFVDLGARAMWEGKSFSFDPKTLAVQPN